MFFLVSNFIHSFKSQGSADLKTIYRGITINYTCPVFTEEEAEAKGNEVTWQIYAAGLLQRQAGFSSWG